MADVHSVQISKFYTLCFHVSVVAFLVALHQNRALLGKDGLLPADKYLNDIKTHHRGATLWDRFQIAPTVIWFLDYDTHIDVILDILAYAGLVLSGFVVLWGAANIPLMLTIWMLYHSIVNVGQRWLVLNIKSQNIIFNQL